MGLGTRFVVHAAATAGRFRVAGQWLGGRRAIVTGHRCRVRHLPVNAGRPHSVRVRGRVHGGYAPRPSLNYIAFLSVLSIFFFLFCRGFVNFCFLMELLSLKPSCLYHFKRFQKGCTNFYRTFSNLMYCKIHTSVYNTLELWSSSKKYRNISMSDFWNSIVNFFFEFLKLIL